MDTNELHWLKSYFEALLAEQNKRLDERFIAQEKALALAVTNAQDLRARAIATTALVVAAVIGLVGFAIAIFTELHK